jgi:hypothetical protein
MVFQVVTNSVYKLPSLLYIIADVLPLPRCAVKLCFHFEGCCLLAYDAVYSGMNPRLLLDQDWPQHGLCTSLIQIMQVASKKM